MRKKRNGYRQAGDGPHRMHERFIDKSPVLPVLVRDLPIYDPILFDHALRGRHVEEFVTTLKQLQEEPDFYQRSAHASYEGHLRYSQETVGAMWKEFYEGVFKNEEETKRLQASRRWNKRERKGAYVWKNKRQQYI